MAKIRDISGMRFGSLVAIKRVGSNPLGHALWECGCDCGNKTITLSNRLLTGNTKTCGCRNGHGMRYSRIYRTWTNMKVRCYQKQSHGYQYYGAKGITVCPEWKDDFSSFLKWAMENGYTDSLTIDRKNAQEGYSPSNCQWITMSENVKKKVITEETKKKMSRSRIGKIPCNKGMHRKAKK